MSSEPATEPFAAVFGARRGVPGANREPLPGPEVWAFLENGASDLSLGDISARLHDLTDEQLHALGADGEAGRQLVEDLVDGLGDPWEREYARNRESFTLTLLDRQLQPWLRAHRPHLAGVLSAAPEAA